MKIYKKIYKNMCDTEKITYLCSILTLNNFVNDFKHKISVKCFLYYFFIYSSNSTVLLHNQVYLLKLIKTVSVQIIRFLSIVHDEKQNSFTITITGLLTQSSTLVFPIQFKLISLLEPALYTNDKLNSLN